MNMKEYQKVKALSYLDYCKYLQEKYGIGLMDYMNERFYKHPNVSRSNEGLYVHHIMEYVNDKIYNHADAKRYPLEWQSQENIVYCDALEHLLLHVMMIRDYPDKGTGNHYKGESDIMTYSVPCLNNYYSGWYPEKPYQVNCCERVANEEDVYLQIIKQLASIFGDRGEADHCSGFFRGYRTGYFGRLWNESDNEPLYEKMRAVIRETSAKKYLETSSH